ncbi:unnamed protein product, partial [Rotaria socialis]
MLTRMQETIKQVQANMTETDEDDKDNDSPNDNKLTFDYLPVEMQREVV